MTSILNSEKKKKKRYLRTGYLVLKVMQNQNSLQQLHYGKYYNKNRINKLFV